MQNILQKISEYYGLKAVSAEKVTKGFMSENHVIFVGDQNSAQNDTQKFFLKKYRFDDKERIEEIHTVKSFFAKGGVPVILPITTKADKTFFEHDGAYYALFPFINEKQLERGSLTDAAVISLGKMLGHIHLLGAKAKLPVQARFNFKLESAEKTLKKIDPILSSINGKPLLDDFDKLALKNIELKKNLIQNGGGVDGLILPSDHLIHGDYLYHNVFFDEHDNVSHVFDFEKTGYSPRTYELLRSMMYGLVTADGSLDIRRMKMYVDAYRSVYPISNDELKKGLRLLRLKSARGFWVESEHYLKDNTRVDGFLKSDFDRVVYLSEHFEELEGALLT